MSCPCAFPSRLRPSCSSSHCERCCRSPSANVVPEPNLSSFPRTVLAAADVTGAAMASAHLVSLLLSTFQGQPTQNLLSLHFLNLISSSALFPSECAACLWRGRFCRVGNWSRSCHDAIRCCSLRLRAALFGCHCSRALSQCSFMVLGCISQFTHYLMRCSCTELHCSVISVTIMLVCICLLYCCATSIA